MMFDQLTHQIKTVYDRCSINHWSLIIWNHNTHTSSVYPLIIMQNKRKSRNYAAKNNCNKERVEVVTVVVMKIHFLLDETSCWSYEGKQSFEM